MIYDFSNLRRRHVMPNYPHYSNTLLEEFFYDNVTKDIEKYNSKRLFIGAFWTNILCENQAIHHEVQNYLDALPRDKEYYTVSQHDLDIVYNLPPNTKIFAAGGLSGKGIPIPLIGDSIPEKYLEPRKKEIFCSGIYSMTHIIRYTIYNTFKDNPDFVFNSPRQWTDSIPENDFINFAEISKKSIFGLAPRGFGLNSFRIYELLQLDCIPVIITDKFYLPFTDELNWNEFCVIVSSNHIHELENILKFIPEEKQKQMVAKGKEVYKNYFTLEKMCDQILKRL